MSLLIVDDNEQMRDVIRAMFIDLADEIYEAANGEEAITSYGLHRQDLVLMDIEMPGCDGITATRRIREDSPGARIVIITAHNSKVLRQAAEDAGACAYLLKENLIGLREMLIAQRARKVDSEVR